MKYVKKILIRTLVPIQRDPAVNNFLKPSVYEARVSRGGLLYIHTNYGNYVPLPGQYEFVKAPPEFMEYWRTTFMLVDAQEEWKHANTVKALKALQKAQSKYEAAKRNFEEHYYVP